MNVAVESFPESIKRKISNSCKCKTLPKEVDLLWTNCCNEMGEDYSIVFIWCDSCNEELYTSSQWGEIGCLAEALEFFK